MSTPKDRSGNPYRRYFTKDRSARELALQKRGTPMQTNGGTFRSAFTMEVSERRDDFVRIEMDVLPEYKNPIGGVHGGMLFTLADNAGGMCCANETFHGTTVDANITYLNPALNTKRLISEASLIKRGRQTAVVEVHIYDENRKELAIARLTYFNLGAKVDFEEAKRYLKPAPTREKE